MPELEDPVVAALPNQSAHPYSALAMSHNRKHAVVAGKDTLQLVEVTPRGLSQIRSLRISQHFQTSVAAENAAMAKIYEDKQRGSFVRDTFGLVAKQSPAAPRQSMNNSVNVVITDVAWSKPQRYNQQRSSSGEDSNATEMMDDNNPHQHQNRHRESAPVLAASVGSSKKKEEVLDSIIAAAGSNGVVVVWSARRAFFEIVDGSSSSMANQQPEAILSQHSRAVNRLAWHPRRSGLLLTASQDATAKLWVRRPINTTASTSNNSQNLRSWFGFNSSPSVDNQSYSWHCRATFEPKSEAVRDIRWSPFHDDIFALVTVSGCLIVYNMFVPGRAIAKISAHAGDATTLDWHPSHPCIIATGGAGDRCVKIWDLESSLALAKDDSNMQANSNTANSRTESIATESSNETDRSGYASTIGSSSGHPAPLRSISFSLLNSSRNKASSVSKLHVLTVAATVTRLKWRPPQISLPDSDHESDLHESMLAVATAPIKGASAGGSGVLGLWTFNRPFMPLSVLEGHKVGAVNDFFWLDTPNPDFQQSAPRSAKPSIVAPNQVVRQNRAPDEAESSTNLLRPARSDITSSLTEKVEIEEKEPPKKAGLNVWQHVLSVGRDGQCLIQSFARGDKPISRVSPSSFALANKSPFSRGFGSLQICSVHQKIPSGAKHDYWLAGLRQDAVTARAPGVFREIPADNVTMDRDKSIAGKRLPEHVPELVFNVVDSGDLEDSTGAPIAANQRAVTVAPEVVHLSRFAKGYKLRPDEALPTRVDLCLHNATVAESLQCGHLARAWRSIASILASSGLDELPKETVQAENVMQFVVLPTLKSLLLERADAGDVQTCVTLCEVLQVIQPDETTRIPGLSLNLIREWYLAYIDLLRDMCLFSLASSIIGTCQDAFIGALNQQSTTIHESCPRCGKPLLTQASSEGFSSNTTVTARRECQSCRRRIGLCFVCHEPVKGMFVWCPGCGHGGHLEHALQWFGGEKKCPTGCGHKCCPDAYLASF